VELRPQTQRDGEAVADGATRGRERRPPGQARQPTDALAKPPCERIEPEVDESMLLINNAVGSCLTMLMDRGWRDYGAPPASPILVTSWK
jgi:hypothetical protein